MHDSVTVHMNAPPEQVWDLVSDVTRIGSYSPETFEAEWLDGATGPAVGARFRGHVKRNGKGPLLVPVRGHRLGARSEFSFDVVRGDTVMNTWAPDRPRRGGVGRHRVLPSAHHPAHPDYWALLGWARGKTNRDGMRTTLEAIRAEVERSGD